MRVDCFGGGDDMRAQRCVRRQGADKAAMAIDRVHLVER